MTHVHSHSHPPALAERPHPDPCDSPGLRLGDGTRTRDTRRMAAALVLTCIIAIVEAIGGWLTGSLALLSDAGHMWTWTRRFDHTGDLLRFGIPGDDAALKRLSGALMSRSTAR